MNPSHHRKMVYGAALAGFVLLILFPSEILGFLFDALHSLIDFLIDMLHHLFEILFELGHLTFEMIESSLDHLVEHLFHTDLHTTQTIVFYTMLIPGLFIGYKILSVLISFTRRCVHGLKNASTRYKACIISYWNTMDSTDKFKWITILGACLYLIFSLSF